MITYTFKGRTRTVRRDPRLHWTVYNTWDIKGGGLFYRWNWAKKRWEFWDGEAGLWSLSSCTAFTDIDPMNPNNPHAFLQWRDTWCERTEEDLSVWEEVL